MEIDREVAISYTISEDVAHIPGSASPSSHHDQPRRGPELTVGGPRQAQPTGQSSTQGAVSPALANRCFCAGSYGRLARDCPPHQPRSWSGPGTPGRPNGTGAARPASGRATPTTRSGHADYPPAVPAFRKLDTIAMLTARPVPAPLRPLPRALRPSQPRGRRPPRRPQRPSRQASPAAILIVFSLDDTGGYLGPLPSR
jgi:hypothetical protein